ncbi:hypothetical protein ACFL5L_05805 [candidate division KSB1 bacterium]
MPHITNFHIILQGSALLFIILLIAGGLTAAFMYRNTVPPLPFRRRLLLALLRAVSITALIAMLFAPLLSITTEQDKKPSLALLIDTSKSMNISDKSGSRRQTAMDILRSSELQTLQQDFAVQVYGFNRMVSAYGPVMPDSVSFDGEGTDISAAIRTVADANQSEDLRGILLLSDGVHNLGENPVRSAEQAGIPIYTVGIGDPTPQRDVLISNVQANEVAYKDTEIPVTVTVRSFGYSNTSASVIMSENGTILKTELIRLPENNMEHAVTFEYEPSDTGIHRLEISITDQADEISLENNAREFLLKALESKTNILVVSGRPNLDYSFMIRSLEKHENFDVTGVTVRPGGLYFTDEASIREQVSSSHLFILIDFPVLSAPGRLFELIRTEVTENRKPVLFIRGRELPESRIGMYRDILRITDLTRLGREEEVYIRLTPEALQHPLFRISEDPDDNSALWNRVPPLFTNPDMPTPAPGSLYLGFVDPVRSLATSFQPDVPLIFINRSGERKTLFFNVYNLWRWKFMALRDPGMSDVYDKLVENSVRWLINKEDSKRVRFSTNKEFYTNGEEVIVNAQVYTENFDPVENAEVRVDFRRDGFTMNRILRSIGEGRYETRLEILEPGEYAFSGEARYHERMLGSDNGSFTIGVFSVEMLKTTADSILLAQMSEASRGRYYKQEEIRGILNELNNETITITDQHNIYIWNELWLLVLIIALLSLEWLFRKRWGLL